jgi:hypothetical protein
MGWVCGERIRRGVSDCGGGVGRERVGGGASEAQGDCVHAVVRLLEQLEQHAQRAAHEVVQHDLPRSFLMVSTVVRMESASTSSAKRMSAEAAASVARAVQRVRSDARHRVLPAMRTCAQTT